MIRDVYPGSRIQGSKTLCIPDPEHCKYSCTWLLWCQTWMNPGRRSASMATADPPGTLGFDCPRPPFHLQRKRNQTICAHHSNYEETLYQCCGSKSAGSLYFMVLSQISFRITAFFEPFTKTNVSYCICPKSIELIITANKKNKYFIRLFSLKVLLFSTSFNRSLLNLLIVLWSGQWHAC